MRTLNTSLDKHVEDYKGKTEFKSSASKIYHKKPVRSSPQKRSSTREQVKQPNMVCVPLDGSNSSKHYQRGENMETHIDLESNFCVQTPDEIVEKQQVAADVTSSNNEYHDSCSSIQIKVKLYNCSIVYISLSENEDWEAALVSFCNENQIAVEDSLPVKIGIVKLMFASNVFNYTNLNKLFQKLLLANYEKIMSEFVKVKA